MQILNPKSAIPLSPSRRALGFCAATTILFSVALAGRADVIINNGDFATGDFTDWNVTETSANPQGLGTIHVNPTTGVTSIRNADYGVAGNGYRVNGATFAAPPGDNYGAFFNASGGTLDLTQSIVVPADGTYSISAQAWPQFADDDIVTIIYDGTALATFDYTDDPGSYVPLSTLLDTTAGSHTVDFQFTFVGTSDAGSPSDTLIGDISMDVATPVPEPTTLLAGALFLIPLAVCSRRYLRQARC